MQGLRCERPRVELLNRRENCQITLCRFVLVVLLAPCLRESGACMDTVESKSRNCGCTVVVANPPFAQLPDLWSNRPTGSQSASFPFTTHLRKNVGPAK